MGGVTEKKGESRKRPRTRGGGVGTDSGGPRGNRKVDPKQKESAGKGKEKQLEMDIGSEESVSKEPSDTGLATAVKGVRHIFCKNRDKINEVVGKLHDDWLWFGELIPPVLFGKATSLFEQVAFSTPDGITSAPFQSTHSRYFDSSMAIGGSQAFPPPRYTTNMKLSTGETTHFTAIDYGKLLKLNA
ncbi:hypothetical protein TIFTF001_036240 [Ficus carica]|uniref:peptidylprolyl isomerase n=1 Tax=Ficus carica TaxID=3494 RepID=A0AA88E6F9_FICCA|nr:hypothetical protein TIFTF001_036240 [Ficus carica]